MSDAKYKCRECGAIVDGDDMGADHNWNGLDGGDIWSNWICPKCGCWPDSLEEGYEEINNVC